MYQEARILFLNCETSMHAGSGDAGTYIDLPIQREKHTGFPKIESSSLKGAIREAIEERIERHLMKDPSFNKLENGSKGFDWGKLRMETQKKIKVEFGADTNSDASGSLGFTDARLLLFPVKSMKGVMAWISCPAVLKRLSRDISLVNGSAAPVFTDLNNLADDEVICTSKVEVDPGKVMLEEYVFRTVKDGERNKTIHAAENILLGDWLAGKIFSGETELQYWLNALPGHLAIVSDDAFRDFVTLHTEVITRNKINNNTGTVDRGALFVEEYLPAESVLYALVTAAPEFSKESLRKTAVENIAFIEENLPSIIQLGGNATIGKGILRTKLESFKPETYAAQKS